MSVNKPFANGVISSDIAVTDIPSGVVAWKIKQRVGCVATIILRYNDGVEQRYLEVVDAATVRPSRGIIGKNTHNTMER